MLANCDRLVGSLLDLRCGVVGGRVACGHWNGSFYLGTEESPTYASWRIGAYTRNCDSKWSSQDVDGGLLAGGSFEVATISVGMFMGTWGWSFSHRNYAVGAYIVMGLLCPTLFRILQWDLFIRVGEFGRKVKRMVLFASVRILRYTEGGMLVLEL